MTKRKTDAEFKKEVYELVGDEYTFLDLYVNSRTKLMVNHTKCGHTYKVIPANFLNGSRCPYCKGNVKKTDIQFKNEIKNLVGDEYTFLDTYIDNKTKIKVKHNKCGHIYKVTPNHFIRGSRCPYCAEVIKKTNNDFKKEVFDLVGDEYAFLDPYVNNKTKLRVKHKECGHIYEVTPHAFLRGTRCPYCSADFNFKKTDDQFKQDVKNLVNNEYVFLDTYVNDGTKLRVKHEKCGKVYKVTPNSFIRGNRCPYCYGNIKKTDTQFKKQVYDLVGNDYVFLDLYVNNHTKIRVKHTKCGHIYYVTPTTFFSKHSRCPYCNSPKGETIITKILNNLNIYYEYQKTFDDLKDTQLLSYDFYIPDQNILIEYQGLQHYEPVVYFGGKKRFPTQQRHDKMKADYAKSHHYNLIAVPYTKDTFSKIKKYLVQHGLKQH